MNAEKHAVGSPEALQEAIDSLSATALRVKKERDLLEAAHLDMIGALRGYSWWIGKNSTERELILAIEIAVKNAEKVISEMKENQ